MNLRDAFTQTKANIMAGNAMMLKGPPGFGKSDLMAKVAAWYKGYVQGQTPGATVGYSVFFMATQTPIGFTGLPWKGERAYKDLAGTAHKYTMTDPAVPQWYMCTDLDSGEQRPGNLFHRVLLVIEEWGQGGPETKRAGAEVLRAGGTPPFYLPSGSARVALSNVDATDGVTKEFDFIIGRRSEITITGDVDVWVEDFADKPYRWQGQEWQVQSFTKTWAKQHPEIVFETKPEKQGPWCNPRTLCSADRYAQVMAEMNGGTIPVDSTAFMEGLQGMIGAPAALSYVDDLRFMIKLPHYEDVVADPKGTPVPTKADLQMCMAYELAGRCKVEHISEVITYIGRLPRDMAVTFISSLLRRDYKNLIMQPAMQAWIAKNAALVSIVASLANGTP